MPQSIPTLERRRLIGDDPNHLLRLWVLVILKCLVLIGSGVAWQSYPSHQLTWKCTDPCGKTTFLLERAFWHFHVSWWEGKPVHLQYAQAVINAAALESAGRRGRVLAAVDAEA